MWANSSKLKSMSIDSPNASAAMHFAAYHPICRAWVHSLICKRKLGRLKSGNHPCAMATLTAVSTQCTLWVVNTQKGCQLISSHLHRTQPPIPQDYPLLTFPSLVWAQVCNSCGSHTCQDIPGATQGWAPTLLCRYLQLQTHLAVMCACACPPPVLHPRPQQTEGVHTAAVKWGIQLHPP